MEHLHLETYYSVKYNSAYTLDVNLINENARDDASQVRVSLIVEMMKLGFIPSSEMNETMKKLSVNNLVSIHGNLLPVLRSFVGDDVDWEPMYPNFPQQVIDASYCELFINAIVHYWTGGVWSPDYTKLPREMKFEKVKFQEINFQDYSKFEAIGHRLWGMKDSMSTDDKVAAVWFIENLGISVKEIPYKEHLAIYATHKIANGGTLDSLKLDTTDILRIATAMSDGDVSLAGNTKFKSFPRPVRRQLTLALEKVIKDEDINRHRGKWVKLFHSLHVGDYSKKVYNVAKRFRNNEKIVTWNSKVEHAIKMTSITRDPKEIKELIELLSERPTEFARRLDKVLRICPTIPVQRFTAYQFIKVIDKVPSRVKVQLLGHFRSRMEDTKTKTFFPKGTAQRVLIKKNANIEALHAQEVAGVIIGGLESSLMRDFETLEPMGKVYIDSVLKRCPMPTQMRSASEGLKQVARGTRMPVADDKSTIRMFIHWIGQDIDLSATFHDESFKQISQVSYTRLKSGKFQTYHSGDITYAPAPDGACEFIDVNMTDAYHAGARYVAMNVLVYSGPTFEQHRQCYAGWMTRTHPESNEIFDPKTVEAKVDVRSKSKNIIPVIFDLKTREAIWVDVSINSSSRSHSNVHTLQGSIEDTVMAIIESKNKTSLYELFELHAAARGADIVESAEEADVKFAINGDVSPYDATIINSEYLV